MTYGFGIIGCGMISRFHAKAIADCTGAKLVGCVDQRPESAEKLAAEVGCTAFASLDAMLASDEIQIVTIGTPSGAHQEPAVAAANAGKHCIIEKPLEITLARCDAILQAAADSGTTVSTIFPSRFHESSQLLKSAVQAGRFGTLTIGDAYVKWFRTQEYYDSGAWRGTWHLDGGGALMNQAIHSVDLLTWLMGPVAEISALTSTLAHERIEVEDVAVANLKFTTGALGVIEATTAAYPGMLKRIEISGSQGTVVIEEEDVKNWEFQEMTAEDEAIVSRMQGKTETGGGAADPAAIGHHGHTLQFQNVIDSLAGKAELLIDGAEGRRSVEIILAIYHAAATGTRVKLPLSNDPPLSQLRQD